MRIVFVAWHGTPHTRRWISFFAERGHNVHVVTCGDGDVWDEDAAGRRLPRPYTVHDLGPPRFGKLGYVAKVPAARRIIRALEPDLVHAHYATSYGMLGLMSGRRPLVVTAHGDDVLVAPRRSVIRLVVRRVLRRASLITVPSEHMRAAVDALTAPVAKRVLSLQYGVEVDRLADVASRTRRRPTGDVPTVQIVCVRHLWPLYRVDTLIRAVGRLRDDGCDVVCEIAGDGPERDSLARLTSDLGLDDRVRFHGYIAPARAEELVAKSDVYVSIAETDGLSVSLLEALALGLVPVLSDIPANRGWIEDGVSGILVGDGADALAEAIVAATRLDRIEAARRNRAVVKERADRSRNLARVEELLLVLVSAHDRAAADERPQAVHRP